MESEIDLLSFRLQIELDSKDLVIPQEYFYRYIGKLTSSFFLMVPKSMGFFIME